MIVRVNLRDGRSCTFYECEAFKVYFEMFKTEHGDRLACIVPMALVDSIEFPGR